MICIKGKMFLFANKFEAEHCLLRELSNKCIALYSGHFVELSHFEADFSSVI